MFFTLRFLQTTLPCAIALGALGKPWKALDE